MVKLMSLFCIYLVTLCAYLVNLYVKIAVFMIMVLFRS